MPHTLGTDRSAGWVGRDPQRPKDLRIKCQVWSEVPVTRPHSTTVPFHCSHLIPSLRAEQQSPTLSPGLALTTLGHTPHGETIGPTSALGSFRMTPGLFPSAFLAPKFQGHLDSWWVKCQGRRSVGQSSSGPLLFPGPFSPATPRCFCQLPKVLKGKSLARILCC